MAICLKLCKRSRPYKWASRYLFCFHWFISFAVWCHHIDDWLEFVWFWAYIYSLWMLNARWHEPPKQLMVTAYECMKYRLCVGRFLVQIEVMLHWRITEIGFIKNRRLFDLFSKNLHSQNFITLFNINGKNIKQ